MKVNFLFLLLSFYGISQYKSIENLTESDAIDYLKIEGYGYNIKRTEESDGRITWTGNNGNNEYKVFVQYTFWPYNLGIQQKSKSIVLKDRPDIDSWIRELPYNLKIIERSDSKIYAGDSRDPEKTTYIKSLVREDEPYYVGEYTGEKYYFWYKNEVNLFQPQIQISDIGFKYGKKDEFYSFLGEDTYNLSGLIQLFFLDYNSYISKKMEKAFLNKEFDKVDFYGNSVIDSNQPTSSIFSSLDKGTIATALGMNNDEKIEIVVNPDVWKGYSNAKRLYILYHELGHDVFNLNHGNGGKMMYNYADKDVTWKDFVEDRTTMFESYVATKIPKDFSKKASEVAEDNNTETKVLLKLLISDLPKLFKEKEYQKIINSSEVMKEIFLNKSKSSITENEINAFYYFAISNFKSGNISVGCSELDFFLNSSKNQDELLLAKSKFYKKEYCSIQ